MGKVDIWMPIYIGDYLSDTMSLEAEDHGVYLLLLMNYWKRGELTDDRKELMRVARLPEGKEAVLENILSQYFHHEENLQKPGGFGRFSQNRIEEEMEKADSRRNASIENGKLGGRPKKNLQKPRKNLRVSKSKPTNNLTLSVQKPKSNLEKSSSPSQCKIDIDTSVSISSAEPAPQKEDRSVYHLIETAFLSKNQDFNYGREGRHLVELEKKALARQDPEGFIKKVICVFWELTHSNDKLFKDQPFLPSILNSSGLWPRVMKRIEQMDEQGAEMDPELEQFIDTLFLEKVK